LSNFRVNYFHNGSDEWAGCVILTPIASSIAHFLYFGFIEMAHFMLFGMGAKTQLVNKTNYSTQVVTILYTVFEFAKYLTNLIFDGVGILRTLSKLHQVG